MFKFLTVTCAVLFAASIAQADYGLAKAFPKTAAGSYGIEIEALSDGRLAVWNGDTIYVESLARSGRFHAAGTGYAGDPGFMALAPDGHTLLLGSGFPGQLYLFDVNAPSDFEPDAVVATTAHYTGVFLTENLVLLDKTTDDYTTCELAILDLSAPSPATKTVMLKPPAVDMPVGGFAASAQLAVDRLQSTVYAMSVVYDSSYMVVANELKRIPVSTLISAYNADHVLDWEVDATSVGGPMAYQAGGPAGVMGGGTVVIGGFGGIQLVDSATGAVEETLMPAGLDYYGAFCNSYTGDIYAIVADPVDYSMDVVYAPTEALEALPALSGAGLALLVALLAAAGVARKRK